MIHGIVQNVNIKQNWGREKEFQVYVLQKINSYVLTLKIQQK